MTLSEQRLINIEKELRTLKDVASYGGKASLPDGPRSMHSELVDIADTRALHVHRSTTQSIANSTVVTVLPNIIDYQFETFGSYSTGTGLFTIRRGGIYLVTASATFVAATGGTRYLRILHTGIGRAQVGGWVVVDASSIGLATTYVDDFELGDTIGMAVFQNSGGGVGAVNLSNATNEEFARFTVTLLGHGK